MNYLKKIVYGDLKFTVNSSGLETDFGELKDPVAFLDSIKKSEISMKKHDMNKKSLTNIRKKIILRDCLILISFLTEETMLSNL